MILVRNLTVRHGQNEVLRQLDADIPAGGITALIGPNGAGKSTLLHTIAGLCAPAQGKVVIDGADLASLSPAARAIRLALLTQNQPATSRLTVADLVSYGRWPHHRGRPMAADHAAVAEALTLFDLDALSNRPLETLSGGQRQRAFVAMAFAQTTPWILLDEPLAALDPRYATDIMTRLWDLTREGAGRSVVIVLHDLNMAARYADHIVALKDGRIDAAGANAEVVTARTLTRIYDTPLAVTQVAGNPVVHPA